jgi:hypothetical protein
VRRAPLAVAAADSPLWIQPRNTVSCTVVSMQNAMLRTDWRLFASVDELASNSGMRDIIEGMDRGLYPEELRRLFNYVRMAGVRITEYNFTAGGSRWGAFQELVDVQRRGVYVVSIDYTETFRESTRQGAHTLQAIYASNAPDGVRFLDTTGRVFNGIAELRQVYGLAELKPDAPIGFVHDSTLVADAAQTVAGLGIYVRVVPIIAMGAATAAVGAAMSSSPLPATN